MNYIKIQISTHDVNIFLSFLSFHFMLRFRHIYVLYQVSGITFLSKNQERFKIFGKSHTDPTSCIYIAARGTTPCMCYTTFFALTPSLELQLAYSIFAHECSIGMKQESKTLL